MSDEPKQDPFKLARTILFPDKDEDRPKRGSALEILSRAVIDRTLQTRDLTKKLDDLYNQLDRITVEKLGGGWDSLDQMDLDLARAWSRVEENPHWPVSHTALIGVAEELARAVIRLAVKLKSPGSG